VKRFKETEMDTKTFFSRDFLKMSGSRKVEGKEMNKSTTLIWFFVQVSILAAAYSATGFFAERKESPFGLITLDESACCMV